MRRAEESEPPTSLRVRLLACADRALRAYERHPLRPLRRLAMVRAERWIVRRQEADGSWGGIQPPWVYSLIALHLSGYPLDHPVMRRGLEGLERFMVEDRDDTRGVGAPPGASRRLEACQSPVWDTALSLIALSDAGLPGDHPALARAADWLLGEEVRVRGDWAVARPKLAPGGWAFEFANVNYPDVDDTAEVVLALRRVKRTPELDAAVERAAGWLQGMQSANGGWGAFDAENTRALVRELPFLDFGEVIDEPSADVTAHSLEMLAALGMLDTPAARRGVAWLVGQQEPSGSWFGRWGVNHVYGTGAAVPALVAAGVEPSAPCIVRAVELAGGAPERGRRLGRGPALLRRGRVDRARSEHGLADGLGAAGAARGRDAGEPCAEAIERGVGWLVATQRADGGWDEPQYTGTGFPSDYYINYHLYRLAFPMMALGRCRV